MSNMQKVDTSRDLNSTSTEISIGSSTSSEHSKLRRIAATFTAYRWKSNLSFIVIAIASIVAVDDLDAFTCKGAVDGVTLYHHVTTFAFVALPLYYMQVILGQYTQLGLVLLNYLNPIGYGIGVTFTFNLLIKIIKNSLLIVDYGIYFLATMHSEMQWTTCPPSYKNICWSLDSSCKKNCLNENVQMSAHIYHFIIFLRNPVIDSKYMSVGFPSMTKVIFLFSTWFALLMLLMCVSSSFFQLRKISLFTSFSLLLIALMRMMFFYGKMTPITKLFEVEGASLVDLHVWELAINLSINLMALGRAFHLFHGSFMGQQNSSDLLTVGVSATVFAMTTFFSLVSLTAIEVITDLAHLDKKHRKHVIYSFSPYYSFIIVPQSMSSLSRCWTAAYFASLLLLLVANQLSHIVVAEKTISDGFPVLIRYRTYTNSAICILCALFSTLLMSRV